MLGRWKKPLIILAAGTGALLVTAATALYSLQNRLLYMPCPPGFTQYPRDNPPMYESPDERGIPFEEFTLKTDDSVQLSGWFLYQPEPARATAPTIVFMHENAGNIGYRLDFFEMLYNQLKVNIVAVSYRGYGYSEGSPSEKGLQKDAEAIMKYTFESDKIDRTKVIVFGRSLGGAVAIYSLSALPMYPVVSSQVKGLILENTFTSIPDMVDKIFPSWISRVKWLVLRNYWNSENRIAQLTMPILFISGEADELIPPKQMKRLHEAAKKTERKKFVRDRQMSVPRGEHNDTWMRAAGSYVIEVKDFIEKCLQSST